MKYIFLPILLLALSCGSSKETANKIQKETVKETSEENKNKLIAVIKYPERINETKQLIVNSGLVWEKLVFDQDNTKIVLITTPEGKRDFWKERLLSSREFKSIEENKTITLERITEEIENTFLAYRKTGCKGTCPVFEIRVDFDGKLFFNGIEHVLVSGNKEIQLTQKEFKSLKKTLQKTAFDSYQDSYSNLRLMDASRTYITYNKKEVEIQIWGFIPSELKDTCKFIEELLIDKKLYEN